MKLDAPGSHDTASTTLFDATHLKAVRKHRWVARRHGDKLFAFTRADGDLWLHRLVYCPFSKTEHRDNTLDNRIANLVRTRK